MKRDGGERRGGGKEFLSVLLLGRCVGDSLGVLLIYARYLFDASSLLNVNCEEVVGSIIVVTTTLCACAPITLFINHLYNIQLLLSLNIQMAPASRQ
jgi:hypothetical protein